MTANGNQDTSDWRRTLVIGNGGSGKTWLARRIAEARDLPVVHLDDLHWLPGRYGTARDKTEVAEDVKAAAAEKRWVIEGVYGLWANIALPRVTTFIWLDLPEDACIDNVRHRGRQGGESETQFTDLLEWIAGYRTRRNNWNSFDAHAAMFDAFAGVKHRLHSRDAVDAFVGDHLAAR